MFDEATIKELSEEPTRAPVIWPSWRHQFELDLTLPLLDDRLSLTPWERLLKNDEARSVLISINHATPFCHDIDQVMTQKFQRITSTF